MERSRLAVCLRICFVLFALPLFSCDGDAEGTSAEPHGLRIFHNPYAEVDWSADLRLKAQHHDHIRLNQDRIRAYDAAGYDVLAPIDYSGAPDKPYALTSRLWPIESVLPANFLQSLSHIRLWYPSAEEVGIDNMHVDSAFLSTYIEFWNRTKDAVKQPWQYETPEELFSLIRQGGGLPIWAHPWTPGQRYQISGTFGVEIYSAFAEARKRQGDSDFTQVDRNRVLIENWDRALETNQTLIGFAVNDHFGPLPDMAVDDDIRDSGKVIVFAKSATLANYREALERGAVLAVRDMGRIKDHFPKVNSISVPTTLARIDTDGTVSWIASGSVIANGPELPFSALPRGTRYLRAEIRNSDGSVVYTQAFWVRPVGDADGNGIIDTQDNDICARVNQGTEQDPDRVAACHASTGS